MLLKNAKMKVPTPIATARNTAAVVNFWPSIGDATSSTALPSSAAVDFRWCFSTRARAIGPPIILPDTRPYVADAKATVVAPTTAYSCSRSGPKEPLVPWPPTNGIEPIHKPRSGFRPNAAARPLPTASCTIQITTASARNINTWTPPFFNRRKQAVKPTLQKKIVMKTLCNVVSKESSRIPAAYNARWAKANTIPPATGAGMQYLLKNESLLTMSRPRQ